MGLLDWFRRRPVEAPELLKLWAEVGALQAYREQDAARTEALKTEWIGMRDELRKLAQRLEKREQRAEQRAAAEEPEQMGFDLLEAQRAIGRHRAESLNGLLHGTGPR